MNHILPLRLLVLATILLFVYMSVWFFVAYIRKRLDSVDIAWGVGFVLVAWLSYQQYKTSRALLVAVLVTIWGLRLAVHIYRRSSFRTEDRRYRELSTKWRGNFWLRAYGSIFLLQGALVLIISLPIMVNATNQPLHPHSMWLSVFGTILWVFGFITEAISDHELSAYLRLSDRPKVLQTGLWHYSRHPNYFGELVQWWGIGIIALQVGYGFMGLLGPLILSILIIFISGIPPIERHRSKDSEYREYQRRTSPLIPLPLRRLR